MRFILKCFVLLLILTLCWELNQALPKERRGGSSSTLRGSGSTLNNIGSKIKNVLNPKSLPRYVAHIITYKDRR